MCSTLNCVVHSFTSFHIRESKSNYMDLRHPETSKIVQTLHKPTALSNAPATLYITHVLHWLINSFHRPISHSIFCWQSKILSHLPIQSIHFYRTSVNVKCLTFYNLHCNLIFREFYLLLSFLSILTCVICCCSYFGDLGVF